MSSPLYDSIRKCDSGLYRTDEQLLPVPTVVQGLQCESKNITIRHHKREPRGQPFPSRWPQGNYKQTRTNHNIYTKEITWMIHKRSTALERSVNKILEGLNRFNGANLTLSSDMVQAT